MRRARDGTKRLKKKRHIEMIKLSRIIDKDSRKFISDKLGMKPDMDRYEKEKMAAVERAAASGGLEIVETDDGELVAVDKDGTFYSTAIQRVRGT